ncbi:hypothetical protein EDB81DRAFT_53768 [Dactylonectria macrodidyma]|uniref:BZIP domain-containing protein n=1 Tax=Dactylonectria macrodidyma TaxID=307937 RepID=A0A9P9J5F9_9HYPO|nr:hypothetical protein EDB81DRAFT_53768 [Dactylonectria macrodidyma]
MAACLYYRPGRPEKANDLGLCAKSAGFPHLFFSQSHRCFFSSTHTKTRFQMSSQLVTRSAAHDAPRSRRRTASSRGISGVTLDRKRAQNRISQQCVRERQAAYVRQMESVLDTLKPSTEDATEQTRYDRLAKAHLKVIDEKQHIKDALFRFRRKLLSVGNLATSAAEDPIFQELSDGTAPESELHHQDQEQPDANSDQISVCETIRAEPNAPNGASHAFPPHQPMVGNPIASDQRHSTMEQLSSESHDQILDSETAQWTLGVGAPSLDAAIVHSASSEYCTTYGSTWGLGHLSLPLGPFDLGAMSSILPIKPSLQMPQAGFSAQTLPGTAVSAVINNSSIFADDVKLAAQNIMSRWANSHATHDHSSRDVDHRNSLVRKLAATAVEVIGALAGLEPYIYGVYFSKYMESVVRWRLSNTLEDRLQIPPPFRPTPLQFTTPDHPMVIDFINWPSIRDQMILYSSALDLDAMSRDIVLNTVIELPNQRAAVNIYDIFFSHILPRVGGGRVRGDKSMLHNREWVYLKVPADSARALLSDSLSITQDALASEMTSRMGLSEAANQVSDVQGPKANSTGRIAPCGPLMTVSRALSAFGIDQPCKWKLSKDFQRKYPYIDCSLDVSNYEMMPASTVALDDVCTQN